MVVGRAGGIYRIRVAGAVVEATLRGRFRIEGVRRLLVGDHVVVCLHDDGAATLEEILPRRSVLKRRTPGKQRGVREVAANLDQVVVVGSVKQPDWDYMLMDRFVTVAEANDLPPTMVVNKCDLDVGASAVAEPYREAGYHVLFTSVPERTGLDELRECLQGKVSLLAGPTGVGKSSLLNALQPGLRLKTAAVSRKSRAGRHTTVAAEMHPLGADAFVVDTPGLGDIGLWGLDPQEVAAAFPEFGPLAGACRFDNCRHLEEPGCAVVASVERGRLAQSRLASYRCLLREADEAARPWR